MNIENLIWVDLDERIVLPEALVPWLVDNASLTQKLKQVFADFSINVLSQKRGRGHDNEMSLVHSEVECVVREVELLGNQEVVVFARSIIPITEDTQDLLAVGSGSLGEVLFSEVVVRGKLQVTHKGEIWGRRSTFTVGRTRLLVSEFFLEGLYAG